MPSGSSEFSDLAAQVQEAQAALAAQDYDHAIALSDALRRATLCCGLPLAARRSSSDRPKVSVVVVAHRATPAHAPLLEMLASLDPAEFETVLVTNSASPIFDPGLLAPFSTTLTHVNLGANTGIGVARTLALRAASGTGVLCLDDDGVTSAEDLRHLCALFDDMQATMVRGRVVAETAKSDPIPPHYDLGPTVLHSFCDIEGFALWRRDTVLAAGGFDPILYGHEGIELTMRLFASQGPEAFVYQPQAVLRHDYHIRPQKAERHATNARYCELRHPGFYDMLRQFEALRRSPQGAVARQMRTQLLAAPAQTGAAAPVSVLTTCRNGAGFVPEFCAALGRQTDQRFQVIFVDDGSDDDSSAILEAHLPKSIARQVIRTPPQGRGAALNTARAAAGDDLCLIADVDDISLPHRVAFARHMAEAHPEAAMIGFGIFDGATHLRGSAPAPLAVTPLSVRAFFGMPAPFPAFGFWNGRISAVFDPDLPGGIDCDWMYRALAEAGVDGVLVPLPATYYHTHTGQITAAHRPAQRSVALKHLRRWHGRLIAPDAQDAPGLEVLTGWSPAGDGAALERAEAYGTALMTQAPRLGSEACAALCRDMARHLAGLAARSHATWHAAQRAETQRQAEKAAALEHAQNALYQSRSWRMTAPYRALARRLGRG